MANENLLIALQFFAYVLCVCVGIFIGCVAERSGQDPAPKDTPE